jgi:simple sugar transport system ATP-binding protein
MKNDGKSLIIITHKLHEVMEISDRVAGLRRGEYIGEIETDKTNPQELTNMMVGRSISLNIERSEAGACLERLRVSGLTVRDAEDVKKLDDVSFSAFGGEILGVAGISGSGQKELLESIAGLLECEKGSSILYLDDGRENELVGKTPLDISKLGVSLAFVPEDRLGMGLVGSMDLADNMMLKSYRRGRGPLTDRRPPRKLAEAVVSNLEVMTPGISTPVRRLSGGNVQKVLVGREISSEPTVLMTAYAVRGLDINTSYTIYRLLNEQKKQGVAVIFVGEDLDVLLELCDRILVLCAGRVSGIADARNVTKEEVGLMMTHLSKEAGA